MTTAVHDRPSRRADLRYGVAIGLFCAVFVFSGVWSLLDPEGAREQFRFLGYPDFLVLPVAVAKLLGVLAILSRRSATLTTFAFAGFLFDLLLALAAHVDRRDPDGWLAVAALVLWVAAFTAQARRRTATRPG